MVSKRLGGDPEVRCGKRKKKNKAKLGNELMRPRVDQATDRPKGEHGNPNGKARDRGVVGR